MTEAPMFPNLFSPVKLGGHELSCRVVFGAHTANMAEGGPAARPPFRLLPGTGARRGPP